MKASPHEISVLCAEPDKYDKLDLVYMVREGKAAQRLGILGCSCSITLYRSEIYSTAVIRYVRRGGQTLLLTPHFNDDKTGRLLSHKPTEVTHRLTQIVDPNLISVSFEGKKKQTAPA